MCRIGNSEPPDSRHDGQAAGDTVEGDERVVRPDPGDESAAASDLRPFPDGSRGCAQDRVADFETPTDGFAQVNLSLAWKPLRGTDNVTVLLQADNLFDAEGRRHASFTKDFVPLAGRNLKLSLRGSF